MAKDLSKSVTDLEKDVEDLFKKIVAVGKDLDTFGKRVEDHGDIFESYGDAIKENEEEIKRVESRLASDIKDKSTAIQILEKKNDTTFEFAERISNALARSGSNHSESIQGVANQVDKLDAETQKEIAETQKEIAETHRVIETATSKQDERMDKIDDKIDKIVARMDKIDVSIAALERHNEEQAHTKRVRNAMKAEIDRMEASIEIYQKHFDPKIVEELSDKIKVLEKELKATRK